MAIEGAITGLYVGADHEAVLTTYTTSAKTAIEDVTGWTIVMDIRTTDRSSTALLSVTGTVSGVFNATPALNTQITTFSLPAALTAKTIFKGDDVPLRASFWRTDTGFKQPLRFGDVALTRTTQA